VPADGGGIDLDLLLSDSDGCEGEGEPDIQDATVEDYARACSGEASSAEAPAAPEAAPAPSQWGCEALAYYDVSEDLRDLDTEVLGLAGLTDISKFPGFDELHVAANGPPTEASCDPSWAQWDEAFQDGAKTCAEHGVADRRSDALSAQPAAIVEAAPPRRSIFERARREFQRISGSSLRSIGCEEISLHWWSEVQAAAVAPQPWSFTSGCGSSSSSSSSIGRADVARINSSSSGTGSTTVGTVSAREGACGRPPSTFSSTSAKQAVALRVAQLMTEMDLTHTGRVRQDEWIHHALLAHSRIPALWGTSMVNVPLGQVMMRQRGALEDLQALFETADMKGTGVLDFNSTREVYRLGLWRFGPSGAGGGTIDDEELRKRTPEDLAMELIEAADLDGTKSISYGEFMAYCVGRRKTQVTVHFYDLSEGMAKAVSPCLLGKPVEGLWHTGVVVYGKEYFFGGEIFYDKPGQTAFGKPTKTLQVGWTLRRQAELHDFIVENLRPIFNREVYDIMQRNCNHFTDTLILWLSGHRLPVEVTNQPEHIMQLPMAKLMRPFLNRWLGNIDGAASAGSAEESVEDAPADAAAEGDAAGPTVSRRSSGSPRRRVAAKDIAAVRLRAKGLNIFCGNEEIIGCDNESMEDHHRSMSSMAEAPCNPSFSMREPHAGWQVPGSMVIVLPADGRGSGIWGIVCAGGQGFDAHTVSADGCWVRWLEVSTTDFAISNHAELRTEFVPRARLAPAREEIASRCGGLYLTALRCVLSTTDQMTPLASDLAHSSADDDGVASSMAGGGSSPRRTLGGASCGWRPTMANLPRSMQATFPPMPPAYADGYTSNEQRIHL